MSAIEIWKSIPTMEGWYEASSLGNIRSVDRLRRSRSGNLHKIKGVNISPKIDKDGYKAITISIDGKKKYVGVHRLIAMAFLGIKNGMQVNHKNGIKTDNSFENLEWVTISENVLHTYKKLGRVGKAVNGKPTSCYSLSGEPMFVFQSLGKAAKFFNGSPSTIRHAVNNNRKTAYGLKWKYN